MKDMDENNLQTLSTIAAMYYLDGISQEEIARRFYTSRSTISRMLKKARNCGVVDIKVNFCSERNKYYEEKLKELFGIQAVIVNSETGELTVGESVEIKIRKELAAWMHGNLNSGDIIGVTRGSIFFHICDYLGEAKIRNVSFAQLMGVEAHSAGHHYARDVVRRLARFYGGRPYYLDAPLVFEGEEARETFFKVPVIAETLGVIQKAAYLMTTVPRLESDQENHIWQGFISREQFEQVVEAGAVGAMFGRAFDINGNFLDIAINKSIVSAELEVIQSRKTVAVSYGKEFAVAMLGALRTGYINDLISDSDCIEEVFRLMEI